MSGSVDSIITQLQLEGRLAIWDQTFHRLAERNDSRIKTYCVSLALGCSAGNRTVNLQFPETDSLKSQHIITRYLAALIYNAIAVLGVTRVGAFVGDNRFCALKKFFYSPYVHNLGRVPITSAAAAWDHLYNHDHEFQLYELQEPSNLPNSWTSPISSAPYFISESTVIVINAGQTELKVVPVKGRKGSWEFVMDPIIMGRSEGYRIPENSLQQVQRFKKAIVSAALEAYRESNIRSEQPAGVILSLACTVRNGQIVPYPNGLSRRLEGVALSEFIQLVQDLGAAFSPAIPVYVINDGDLLARTLHGNLQDHLMQHGGEDIVFRIGTTLAAGIVGLDVLSELGWMIVSMCDNEDQFETTGVSGLLRSRLSWVGIQDMARRYGILVDRQDVAEEPSLESELNKKSLSSTAINSVFSEVGKWIADAVILIRHFVDVKSVWLGGSILSGRRGKVTVRTANSILAKSNIYNITHHPSVALISEDAAQLRFGVLRAAPKAFATMEGISINEVVQ